MNTNRLRKKKKTGLIWAFGCAFLCVTNLGCVTLPTSQNSSKTGKQGKDDCCEGCEKDKANKKKTSAVYNMAPQAHVAQRKVLPEEINSGNYHKMLKNLEEEVDQSTVQP